MLNFARDARHFAFCVCNSWNCVKSLKKVERKKKVCKQLKRTVSSPMCVCMCPRYQLFHEMQEKSTHHQTPDHVQAALQPVLQQLSCNLTQTETRRCDHKHDLICFTGSLTGFHSVTNNDLPMSPGHYITQHIHTQKCWGQAACYRVTDESQKPLARAESLRGLGYC